MNVRFGVLQTNLHAQFQNAKPFVSTVSKITDFMSRQHREHSRISTRQVSQPSIATHAHNADLLYLLAEEKDMAACVVSPLEFRCSSLPSLPNEASPFGVNYLNNRSRLTWPNTIRYTDFELLILS